MGGQRFNRQSFLGEGAQEKIEGCRVGLVGLGGGGSHIVLQLAHLGFRRFVLCDDDVTEETNLNRNVCSTARDAEDSRPKIEIAERVIRALTPDAEIVPLRKRWQDGADHLRGCDIIFGCVDSFSERHQLEAFTRRHLIPYIDIGMDVHPSAGAPPVLAGQIILSLPGGPCMRCIGFITDENLTREASRYGAAGERPQVVWPNGVLASTAVGIAVDLVTDWAKEPKEVVYLSYYGNVGTIAPHPHLEYLPKDRCAHYLPKEVGGVVFRPL